MKSLRAALALTLVLMTGCVTTSEPYELTAEQIRPYIEFVERETGYKLDPPPRVVVSRSQMALSFSGSDSALAYAPNASFSNKGELPTIYLDEHRFSFSVPRQTSSLVHELVHHGQYLAYRKAQREGRESAMRSQKGWVCGRSVEAEAYRIQNVWLSRYPNERPVGEHDRGCPNGPGPIF